MSVKNSSFFQIFPFTFFYLEFLKKSTKTSKVYLKSSPERTCTKTLRKFWKYWFHASLMSAVLVLLFNNYITRKTLSMIIIDGLRDASYVHHFMCLFSLELAFGLSSPIFGSSVRKIWQINNENLDAINFQIV